MPGDTLKQDLAEVLDEALKLIQGISNLSDLEKSANSFSRQEKYVNRFNEVIVRLKRRRKS